MIVYVESNFVLEIALEQEQSEDAVGLLELAEDGKIQLVIPDFGLSEPYSRIRQRGRDRFVLYESLVRHARDLSRSKSLEQLASALPTIADQLRRIEAHEMDRKVFLDPDIVAELQTYNCKFLPMIRDAYAYVGRRRRRS